LFGGAAGGAIAIGVFALLGGACSTPTTSTNVWKNPSYAGGPVNNVIVFGARMNETNRRTVEDGFVSALSNRGVHATPSYTVFLGPMPSRQTAQQQLQNGPYDTVLVSTARGVSERTTVEPGGLYGDWGWAWEPSYLQTDTYVKFETTLWDPHGGGTMIWSDVTQTENPSSAPDFMRSLLKTVVPEMQKAGLLPKAGESVSTLRPQTLR
jgi:hypothetical protein